MMRNSQIMSTLKRERCGVALVTVMLYILLALAMGKVFSNGLGVCRA